ncbi:hypothetical protein OQA88_1319 [Cercophora sp. LCS_1]
MAVHSEPPREADRNDSTEESPLLSHVGDASGNSFGSAANLLEVTKSHSNGNGIVGNAADEEQNIESSGESSRNPNGFENVARVISVLLIGIFVAHTDGSIMLATHPAIASEFNDLKDSPWLITSFALAGAATQTLYGKLSDIYGRKPLVLIAYCFVVVGCIIVGAGQSMWQVVFGRIVSGAGTSGMTALVSVLITDLLPLREVAQWRAYVNVVATTGRSIGGPSGGWLADVVGWRWSFLGQAPILGIAIILCSIYLPGPPPSSPAPSSPSSSSSSAATTNTSKFSRIDIKGSILFATSIITLLLPLELGGTPQLPWTSPPILALFTLSILLLTLFIRVEKRHPEPILPLEIFHRRDAVLSFLIMGLQTAAQISLMFSVPLYFQVTNRLSNTASGLHLVPAVVGNAIGGLLAGLAIKKTGRYKALTIFSVTCSSFCYLLLMFRWHGNTNWFESLYIIPGGFGTGMAQSALFISVQVVIPPAHLAPAISFMYLSTTVWLTIGLPISNAAMQGALRKGLTARLLGLGLGGAEVQEILANAISDVDYVGRVTGAIREAIVQSYVDGLWWSHAVSFVSSSTAFVLSLFLKQRRLDAPAS